MNTKPTLSAAAIAIIALINGCKPKPQPTAPNTSNMPDPVANILVANCAISGCHNAASYSFAANLRLDTWESLFEGSSSGSVVVPYSAETSPLLYYVNTDSNMGPVATPTMPISTSARPAKPLTTAQYQVLKDWINAGAPDKNGKIAFADNAATRQKIYLTQQGCDKVAVIDAGTHLVMRYINVGTSPSIESPHAMRTSSDGKFGYVSFLAGQSLQKIDLNTDQLAGSANLTMASINGSWNTLYLSPDNNTVLATDFRGDGLLARIGTTDMAVTDALGGGNTLVYPHGVAANQRFDTLWVTAQYGNVIYKLSTNQRYYKKLSLDGRPPSEATSATGSPDPHEVLMDAAYTRAFITCEGTNEVKVLNTATNKIDTTIAVGKFPQELVFSQTTPYLFVSCMEDDNSRPGLKGSVYAINYNTYATTKIEGDFYQPHGIAVDDQNGNLYVASTNANPSGPAPHHATSCNGRAGWYSVIDLKTLRQTDTKRYQVLVLPYSAAARFR